VTTHKDKSSANSKPTKEYPKTISGKMPEPPKIAIKKTIVGNGVFSLNEVQIFINQHNAKKPIVLPGRTAKDIEVIHEAYNKSTFKYAKNILEILNKWTSN
jgi:hypothetical protein